MRYYNLIFRWSRIHCHHDIRIAGRNTQGVTIFRTDKSEKVVSAIVVPGGDEGETTDENEME